MSCMRWQWGNRMHWRTFTESMKSWAHDEYESAMLWRYLR